MMRRIALVALALLAACKSESSNGYAVDLTIVPGASLSPAAVRTIDAVDIAVSGAESFSISYPVTDQLLGGQARWIYRPLVSGGTLDFSVAARASGGVVVGAGRAEVVLAPGGTRSATVTLEVAPVADGGSDGGSDLSPGACTPSSCAALHQDCDPVTLACVACAAPPSTENRTNFFADASATGSVTGSQGCPYPSVTAALVAANATTATFPVVHVAAGMYSAATGESFPLIVRKSIAVAGAGASSTVVNGQGLWSGTMLRSQANDMYQATMVVGSAGGTVSISGLTLKPTVAAPTVKYIGVFCDTGNLPNLPQPQPNTTLSGLVVGPNYDTGVMVTNSALPADSACNLKLLASTISGNQNGVQLLGDGNFAPPVSIQPVAVVLGDGTAANANTLANNHLIPGSLPGNGSGLVAQQGVVSVLANKNTFASNDSGAYFLNYGRFPLDFEANLFTGHTYAGIYVQFDELLILNNNTFSGNLGTAAQPGTGVIADGGSHVKARSNQFIGNDTGVNITGNGMVALGGNQRSQIDFGKDATDRGNNVFSCNSLPPHNYDVFINLIGGSDATPMTFEGNSWDHNPPTTGAANAANGTDVVNASSATAPAVLTGNVVTPVSTACPAGKIQ